MSSCGWVVASPPRRRGPHRQGDDATVYTNRWKRPLGAVLGHLCTLLGLWAWVVGGLWDRNSVHKWEDQASPRRFGAFVYTIGPLRCCGQTWGRRSVHRLAKMASPHRFGSFVYTVATRVTIRIATRAALGGTSASATTACRRRPLAGPSRLVGKTGSARVAPLPGWHLRRGVNPHEPLKSTKNGPTHYGVGPRTSLVDRQGFEPWTLGLRVPCSTS